MVPVKLATLAVFTKDDVAAGQGLVTRYTIYLNEIETAAKQTIYYVVLFICCGYCTSTCCCIQFCNIFNSCNIYYST